MTTPERIIKFTPAWNKHSSDPNKDYGIGAMGIWFYLKGELAVVQFHLSTRWYLPADAERNLRAGAPREIPETDPERLNRMGLTDIMFGSRSRTRKVIEVDYYAVRDMMGPEGWDVGYHSPVPLYEEQSPMSECEFFKSPQQCYYDGSSLRAKEWTKDFLANGTDWLWGEMTEELSRIEARVKEQLELIRNCS